jgi:hypothetical protein
MTKYPHLVIDENLTIHSSGRSCTGSISLTISQRDLLGGDTVSMIFVSATDLAKMAAFAVEQAEAL